MKPCHQNGEAVPQIHVMALSLKTQNLQKNDRAVIGHPTSTLLPFEQYLYDIYYKHNFKTYKTLMHNSNTFFESFLNRLVSGKVSESPESHESKPRSFRLLFV